MKQVKETKVVSRLWPGNVGGDFTHWKEEEAPEKGKVQEASISLPVAGWILLTKMMTWIVPQEILTSTVLKLRSKRKSGIGVRTTMSSAMRRSTKSRMLSWWNASAPHGKKSEES